MARVDRDGWVHLHRDDHPQALLVLAQVLVARRHDPVGLADIGYEPTEWGVWVNWDALIERSWLSSTETAAVIVARGIAAAERQGGWPARFRQVIADAVEAL